jgi:uroporphyrinogen decarboxylase
MKSRERAVLSLRHQEPDRVPMDLGGTILSTIHETAHKRLLDYLGLEGGEAEMLDIFQYAVRPDKRVLEKFGIDFYCIMPEPAVPWKRVEGEDGSTDYIDEWGIRYRMPRGGYYFDVYRSPLAHVEEISDLKAYKWPLGNDKRRMKGLAEKVKGLFEHTDYALVMSDLTAGMWMITAWLLGFKNFYTQLAGNPKLIEYMVAHTYEIQIQFWGMVLDEIGKYVQVVQTGDDIAGQDGPLFNPDLYRKILKPRQKKLVEFIKSKTEAKVFYHVCGSVYGYLKDFIDVGYDIINPMQVSAKDMGDSARIKREFGKDLTFWGGGIDIHKTLPNGTVSEVKEEVKRRLEALKPGGGFVFCPSHNVQRDVPPENVIACYETALEHASYK